MAEENVVDDLQDKLRFANNCASEAIVSHFLHTMGAQAAKTEKFMRQIPDEDINNEPVKKTLRELVAINLLFDGKLSEIKDLLP